MKIIFYVFIAILVVGCATPLRDSPAQLKSMQSTHGIVMGSAVIKLRDDKVSMARSLENLAWYVVVKNISSSGVKSPDRSIRLMSDAVEVPIVAGLPEGTYEIQTFSEQGLEPNVSFNANVRFKVTAKTNTYIGRLVVTIPKEVSVLDSMLFVSRPVDIFVEDAYDDFSSQYSKVYTAIFSQGLVKGLMIE